MITAEEFFEDNKIIPFYTDNFHLMEIHNVMIEFAKLHVEQALKEASNTWLMSETDKNDVLTEKSEKYNKNSILNSYPLSNIK